MSRLMKFEEMSRHPMMGRMYERLSAAERNLCREFIIRNAELDKDKFCELVNRWYLDNPNKPKRLSDMWALVLQSA